MNEPTEYPPTTHPPVLPALVAMAGLRVVHAHVAALLTGVGRHGVDASTMELQHVNDLVLVELTAGSAADLDVWLAAFPGAAVVAAQRTRVDEAGVRFGLGGLTWRLFLGELVEGVRVTVRAVSLEDEDVAGLAIARAGNVVPAGVGAGVLAVAA